MKWLFVFLGLIIIFPPVFGVPIADKTGLKFSSSVDAYGDIFVIEGAGNFDVRHIDFDQQNKALVLTIESSLEDNLMEIVIPQKLIGENLIFLLDGTQVEPDIKQGSTSSLATLEFNGIGMHTLTISETLYQNALSIDQTSYEITEDTTVSNGGGCLIATATFGSELASEVQFLRELRDNTILQTQSGTAFMTGFNHFYYSFSPTVADYERENPVFKETVKLTLTPLLTSLTLLNYVNIDTEQEMVGYGTGVILLNIGMYFVAPALLILSTKKLLFLKK